MGRCLPQAPAFYFWFPPEEPFHCLRFASRQLRQRVTHSLGRRRQRGWQRAWRPLAAAVAALPVRSCVIDGELTACDTSGVPNFRALHFNSRDDVRYVWAFNLLYLNGKDLRPLPPRGSHGSAWNDSCPKIREPGLCYTETFTDGSTLFRAADRMGLEGIVSKKAAAPYRSGSKCDWIKVKCPSWREANR
jgi:bifunctional non-homologous end joining protein LigD